MPAKACGRSGAARSAKRALAALNQYLGDAVGKAYADKYFPAAAKAEVGDMVEGIKTEPGWITTETLLMRSRTVSLRRLFYRTKHF